MPTSEKVKLKAGGYLIPVEITEENGRWFFAFGYNKDLLDEIKTSFENRKWHGFEEVNPRKVWSAPITRRNKFVLDYLKDKYGSNPYKRFLEPVPPELIEQIKKHCKNRNVNPFSHQIDGIAHGLHKKQFILAYDMGLGKTFISFMIMEMSGVKNWLWCGPKSALRAVQEEKRKWQPRVEINFSTYEDLKKIVTNWPKGYKAPRGIIFDESSKLKTPTAQRTVAAHHIADSAYSDWDGDCYIGLLSGSPAPKSPVDWWSQCEIAASGYIREGSEFLFKERLGLIENREGPSGGSYPQLITWRDDENKCATCGQPKASHATVVDHPFQKSINEVAKLHRRMKGLVDVKLKKDCTDLPDKYYEIARCDPSEAILNAAKLITIKSRRAIEALTLLRELSDGFQYRDSTDGTTKKCPLCDSRKVCHEWYDQDNEDDWVDPTDAIDGKKRIYNEEGFEVEVVNYGRYKTREVPCTYCKGQGHVPNVIREVVQVPCPKDSIFKDELDLHLDIGRFNIYAGFTASVDRLVGIAQASDWATIRVDGRGWLGQLPDGKIIQESNLLQLYQEGQSKLPRIVFIGQPGAAGMGLTLTASPTTGFFSNDFNGESRIQAEDRGHRLGMNRERGGRILDMFHLSSDEYVYNNLKKKKDLQKLSITGLQELFNVGT